ncbi:MAG: type II toxin-antitoxin system HicA family toxin [bacterium]|nr:type II toxin-antitoxin system HicA family toxin [bacterium]
MKVKELEKLPKEAGWSKTEGANHSKWSKDGKSFPVPRHPRDIAKGTLNAILKQAGLK